jgi:two-component system LytT family response regulator
MLQLSNNSPVEMLNGNILMNRIKTLIIDDEWLIRSELKTMLVRYPNIDVIGEAANVMEAIKLYEALKPDLVFLDIQLPGGSGFDFLNRVDGSFKLVFITAFDQFLNEAKQYRAIDYLMKPISKDKLSRVIRKL